MGLFLNVRETIRWKICNNYWVVGHILGQTITAPRVAEPKNIPWWANKKISFLEGPM